MRRLIDDPGSLIFKVKRLLDDSSRVVLVNIGALDDSGGLFTQSQRVVGVSSGVVLINIGALDDSGGLFTLGERVIGVVGASCVDLIVRGCDVMALRDL